MSFNARDTAEQLSLLLINNLNDDSRMIYLSLSRRQRDAVNRLLGSALVEDVRRQLGLGER